MTGIEMAIFMTTIVLYIYGERLRNWTQKYIAHLGNSD